MIHVQTWTGATSGRITDMTNARKRGKTCDVIRFSGWNPYGEGEPYETIRNTCYDIRRWLESLPADSDFATVAAELERRVNAAGLPEHACAAYRETIRGVDAPLPVLTASGPNDAWTASATIDGITIYDNKDQNNLPAVMVNGSIQKAYGIVAKHWDRVKACPTFHSVDQLFRELGLSTHYWCRMD